MPTSRAYGALPKSLASFGPGLRYVGPHGGALHLLAPPSFKPTTSSHATQRIRNSSAMRIARSTHPASKTTEFRASSGARRHHVSTQDRGRFAFAMKRGASSSYSDACSYGPANPLRNAKHLMRKFPEI
jgi:hypothetical protein